PNQGRGAPEIDILEGGGAAISSSIQVAPGMPDEYRRMPIQKIDNKYCVYGKGCETPGANMPDVPTATYAYRKHMNWYQGLKYAANNRCPSIEVDKQQPEPVIQAQKNRALVTANGYNKLQMSAGRDVNADLSFIDGKGPYYWGINHNGTCFPVANGYIGAFLCDPDAKNPKCEAVRKEGVADTNQMDKFEYQMDAISANWDIGHEAYVTFYTYQVEWVMGENGYVRWNLFNQPLYEIPSSSLTNPPQAPPGKPRNPKKVQVEEPLYIIFNVALARAWGATPPNADIGPCRGNATHPAPGSDAYKKSNNICDSFPMYMEVDYLRIYQDKTTMAIGCDPPTHPTKEWIDGHIKWYTDAKNPMIRVDGGATCNSDDDCLSMSAAVASGRCKDRRCACASGYGGPRCTKFKGSKTVSIDTPNYFGPQLVYPAVLAAAMIAGIVLTAVVRKRRLASAASMYAVAMQSRKKRQDQGGDEGDDKAGQEGPPAQRRFYAPANMAEPTTRI
ncbi:hypothetical protein As57867_015785, partial [Aphanomyces stellatus]